MSESGGGCLHGTMVGYVNIKTKKLARYITSLTKSCIKHTSKHWYGLIQIKQHTRNVHISKGNTASAASGYTCLS